MARIAGVDLPKDKRIEIGLTYVYGIGRTSAKKILEMTGINPDTRVKDSPMRKRQSCVSALTTTTSLRATCAVRRAGHQAPDRDRLLPRQCVIAAVCLFAGREARQTHVPARARSVPSQIKRSKGGI